MRLTASCHCGNLSSTAEFTRAPGAFQPRACDCGFCTRHAAAWISDPNGQLEIDIRDAGRLSRYRQGSGSAEFLICATCGVLLAATLTESGHTWGVLNLRALESDPGFATPAPASPRLLDAGAKRDRWRQLWFPDVRLRDA